MKSKSLLKITFLIDAIIAIGFGLYSWLFPQETFGTLFSIPEAHESLFFAILSSMSILYVLLGLVCLIGYKADYPVSVWLGYLMIFRHGWMGVMKMLDIGKEWLIGDPYPDIIIHSIFVVIYVLAIYLKVKAEKNIKFHSS